MRGFMPHEVEVSTEIRFHVKPSELSRVRYAYDSEIFGWFVCGQSREKMSLFSLRSWPPLSHSLSFVAATLKPVTPGRLLSDSTVRHP